MRIRLTALAAVLALAGGTAVAQDDQFAQLDADGSGGLSLSEVQAVLPQATETEFAQYDADQSGELSASEFGAWAGSEG
jgi:hypothetical protein